VIIHVKKSMAKNTAKLSLAVIKKKMKKKILLLMKTRMIQLIKVKKRLLSSMNVDRRSALMRTAKNTATVSCAMKRLSQMIAL